MLADSGLHSPQDVCGLPRKLGGGYLVGADIVVLQYPEGRKEGFELLMHLFHAGLCLSGKLRYSFLASLT